METCSSGVGPTAEGEGVEEVTFGNATAEVEHGSASSVHTVRKRVKGCQLDFDWFRGNGRRGAVEGKLKTAWFGFCMTGGRGKGAASVHDMMVGWGAA